MARGILKGFAWSAAVLAFLAVALTIIVESNENYWWYGPVWRINTLFGAAGCVVVGAFLIPVLQAVRKPGKEDQKPPGL